MDNVIINRKRLPDFVAVLLPKRILWAIESADASFSVEEIRLRKNRPLWICGGRENLMLDVEVSEEELEETLLNACGGSLYSCAESIARGFVPTVGHIRIGVCGEWTKGGIRKISSLAIRVPHRHKTDAAGVRAILEDFGMSRGLLLFSPPLGGKTSFLREIAAELASGKRAYRVIVVDTRGELGFALDLPCLNIDILSGYPRREGIEIAARTLGAQVVICDEIGVGDTDAIAELHGGGVPLVASAHAATLHELVSRRGIAELHRAGVFGGYLELDRYGDKPYVFYGQDDTC